MVQPSATSHFMWYLSSLSRNQLLIKAFGSLLWLFFTFIIEYIPTAISAQQHLYPPNHASPIRQRPYPWYGLVTRSVVAVVCPYSLNHSFLWSSGTPSTSSQDSRMPVTASHKVLSNIPSGDGFLKINQSFPAVTPTHAIIVSSMVSDSPASHASRHLLQKISNMSMTLSYP